MVECSSSRLPSLCLAFPNTFFTWWIHWKIPRTLKRFHLGCQVRAGAWRICVSLLYVFFFFLKRGTIKAHPIRPERGTHSEFHQRSWGWTLRVEKRTDVLIGLKMPTRHHSRSCEVEKTMRFCSVLPCRCVYSRDLLKTLGKFSVKHNNNLAAVS